MLAEKMTVAFSVACGAAAASIAVCLMLATRDRGRKYKRNRAGLRPATSAVWCGGLGAQLCVLSAVAADAL